MVILPDHIEKYLTETGFSTTEILILKRLLEGEEMTLRELATKMAKSTGVLDQAMKKLIGKKIVNVKTHNGTTKYELSSIDSIIRWVKEDTRQQWESMKRKEQDFASFISSVQEEKRGPKVEYFSGMDGLQKAYARLLEGGNELLQFFPFSSVFSADQNPLKDFRDDFIKARRKIGMFSRVIAHDTPQGRKYQSRDVFEFRKTALIPEGEYSCNFEKLISGNLIACFDREASSAFIIDDENLAQAERYAFEVMWGTLSRHIQLPSNGFIVSTERSKLSYIQRYPRWLRDVFKLCGFLPRTQFDTTGVGKFSVDLEVHTKDRTGLIHDLSRPYAERNIDIGRFIFFALPPDELLVEIESRVHSLEEASYLIDELQRIAGVISVVRRK